MPTIDQLAPATAAADSDVFIVSQGGIARKLTRSQALTGVQAQLSIDANRLLGRGSAGAGVPESIAIGANLTLANGTISATAAPYQLSALNSGYVPSASDLVGIGQSGSNVAVTYAQFVSGLASVPNVNLSNAVVFPTGTQSAVRLADYAAASLPLAGGTVTGPLLLAATPVSSTQAATKAYVDGQVAAALPRSGGTLSGTLVLASDPVAAYQAATKTYVDAQIGSNLPKTGGTLTGPLVLPGDPSASLQAATKQYADARVARSGDTLSGPLVLSSDPLQPLQAATKSYVDSQAAGYLPRSGGSLTGALQLASDPVIASQAATKQYVDSRVVRNGDTLTGPLGLAGDPMQPLQAATKGYVDAQLAVTLPKSGGTLSGPLTLNVDPVLPLQAASKQYADAKLARSGDSLTGVLSLAADPTAVLHAATKGYVDNQVATALPKAGGTLTATLALAADPTSAMQAATKRYVDSQVTTALPMSGGSLSGPLALAASPVSANQAATKGYVDSLLTGSITAAGGTLTGPLSLLVAPTSPQHAVNKQYVDANPGANGVINVKLAPYGAKLDGVTDDTAAFKAAYQAAAAGSVIYVPNGTAVLQSPSSWGVDLTKRVKWVVDGTALADGTSLADTIPTGAVPTATALPGVVTGNSSSVSTVSRNGSQSNDFALLHTSYVVNHSGGSASVVTNNRSDTIIYNSPGSYVWNGLDRIVWTGIQTPTAAAPAQHVGRYVQAIRQAAATGSNGAALPQPQLWAACLEYRDVTGKPSSAANASITVEMDWFGNGADDAKQRAIQSLVVGQHDTSGTAVEVNNIVGVYLAAGSSGKAYTVFSAGIPFATAVLDTTYSQQLTGAAAVRLAAGHSVAFETTNSYRLAFDSATSTLRWNQGTLSYVVGKGISVGWQSVYAGNATLPAYLAGNIVFLIGAGNYTISLPAASTVPAGTGFTFSALGSGSIFVAPAGSDALDLSPVILRQYDRYHIVSDGSSTWREVFRTNAYAPRFGGPPVLPSYAVASLPASPGAGAKAFVTNGRKPGENAGAGTGVEVFYDGSRWISTCSGSAVLA